MSLQPPDLGRPYSTEVERADAREALLLYWSAIELLTKLAEQPANEWSPEQVREFPVSVPGSPGRASQHRLQRWFTVYSDEINIVGDIRNTLVHGGLVADSELRGAAYLARNVIATAMGVLPSEAESAARKVQTLA